MSEHPIESLMGVTMQKIREMVDVNTIIGDPITTPDGTVRLVMVLQVVVLIFHQRKTVEIVLVVVQVQVSKSHL